MTTATKERPILFNAEMVRAILSGAKTQTRRPVKWREPGPIPSGYGGRATALSHAVTLHDGLTWPVRPNPFGPAGTVLWCRETFQRLPGVQCDVSYRYRATDAGMDGIQWTPSIHMPRWASRISLRVKRVWVERVQDITCADVEAEGMPADLARGFSEQYWFRDTWDSIYAKSGAGWDENPWVWCCEFKVVT